MLDFIRKGFTVKQIIDAVKIAKESELRALGYFMIGMLGENEQMIRDTMELAMSLKLNSGAFGITSPILGTDLYEMALKKGVINDGRWWRFDRGGRTAVNLTQELTLKQLDVLRKQANWEIFWNSPDRRLRFINRALLKLSPLVARIEFDKIVLCVENMRKTFRIPLP